MYPALTGMPGESYHGPFRSLLLCPLSVERCYLPWFVDSKTQFMRLRYLSLTAFLFKYCLTELSKTYTNANGRGAETQRICVYGIR